MELTNRKYGVEIEILRKNGMMDSVAFAEITSTLAAAGIDCQYVGYTHSTTSFWKVLTDGSCGLEVVSPVLSGEEGFRQIEIVCNVLNKLGYRVDRSTGLHVHHDARNLTRYEVTSVFALAMKWESVIDHLVAPSRVNNQFCKSNTCRRITSVRDLNTELQNLRRAGAENYRDNGNDRYLKVNYQAYMRHGTIEFRQHQGTIDATKIIHWIILTQNLITHAINCGASWKVTNASAISFKRFRDMLGCTGKYIENNVYVKQAARTMLERFATFSNGMNAYDTVLANY